MWPFWFVIILVLIQSLSQTTFGTEIAESQTNMSQSDLHQLNQTRKKDQEKNALQEETLRRSGCNQLGQNY